MERFYTVWNPTTCELSKKHSSKEAAIMEAKRLIKERNIDKFYILQGVASVENNNIVVKDLFDPVEF